MEDRFSFSRRTLVAGAEHAESQVNVLLLLCQHSVPHPSLHGADSPDIASPTQEASLVGPDSTAAANEAAVASGVDAQQQPDEYSSQEGRASQEPSLLQVMDTGQVGMDAP